MTETNTITDLRQELFAQLRELRDTTKKPDVERAMAVRDIAQTIINSAKVEVDRLKITGGQGSGFIPELPAPKTGEAPAGTTVEPIPGGRRVTHRMVG